MDISGIHEFGVPREILWDYLMDPVVLAKITPGISKLEHIKGDMYKTISVIKIGPVKGSFNGKLTVENKKKPEAFDIKMEQFSKIGNAHATIKMNIKESGEDGCILNFGGHANLSGTIARTGQRVLSGVANTLTKEVFSALEQHIAESNENQINPTTNNHAEIKQSENKGDLTENIFKKIFSFLKNLFGTNN